MQQFTDETAPVLTDYTPDSDTMLIVFGGFFGACWVVGFGVQWLIVGVVNALAGLFYLWRIFNWRGPTQSGKSS